MYITISITKKSNPEFMVPLHTPNCAHHPVVRASRRIRPGPLGWRLGAGLTTLSRGKKQCYRNRKIRAHSQRIFSGNTLGFIIGNDTKPVNTKQHAPQSGMGTGNLTWGRKVEHQVLVGGGCSQLARMS